MTYCVSTNIKNILVKKSTATKKISLQSREEKDQKNQWKGNQRRKATFPTQRARGVKEKSRKRRLMSSNSSLGCPVIARGCPSPACLFVCLFLFRVLPEANVQTVPNLPYRPGRCGHLTLKMHHEPVFKTCKSWNHWTSFLCCRIEQKRRQEKNKVVKKF